MLYSVKSSSQDYSRITINLDIPWRCDYVKYYVSSINTKANILLTTDEDYLEFTRIKVDGLEQCLKIPFPNMYAYSFGFLVKYLNEKQNAIVFKSVNNRTISLQSAEDIVFMGGTHRAKLITGFFDTKPGLTFPKDVEAEVPDIPILDFANKLYLVSL